MTLPLQPLSHHLEELKRFFLQFALIVGVGCFFLLWWGPALLKLIQKLGPEQPPLLLLSPLEGFSLLCRLAFWGSFIGSSPFWLMALLQFMKPALYPHETKSILSLLLGSYIALSLGIWVGLQGVLPWSVDFFASFNQTIGQNAWSAANYAEFALSILFSMSCLAEICFLFFWLLKHGFLPVEELHHYRRWWIFSSFVLGAILTPPDVVSQFCMALPLILLFELACFFLRVRSNFLSKRASGEKILS